MPNIKLTRSVVLCGCLLSGMLVGCSSRTDPDAAIASVNATNLQRLANLYFTYQSQHDWHGPPDEADFKSFLRGYNPHKLTRIGVDPNEHRQAVHQRTRRPTVQDPLRCPGQRHGLLRAGRL